MDKINSVYFYTGDERYLIDVKMKFIINESHADEFNIESFDMDEVNVKEAIRAASTQPFMSENKVVIIKNPRFLANEKMDIEHDTSLLKNYIENPNDTTVLLIDACGIKISDKNEIVKILRAKKTEVNIPPMDETIFIAWFKRQLALDKITVKDDAAKMFFNLVGRNLVNAKTEVEKLSAFVGPEGVVTSKVISQIVVKEFEQDIYSLSNAILDNNKELVINNYRDLIATGYDVNMLLNTVVSTVKNQLITNLLLKDGYKQYDIANFLGVSPGKAYYLVKNSKSIDIENAKNYIKKLGNLDYKIKSGQVDAKTGFEFFLFGI